jgi:SAM-dependent methyltransferase
MAIVGHPTTGQLHQLLTREELNPERRDRLFGRFGGPRAALVRGLTDAVLRFIVAEWESLHGSRVLDYGCGVMPYYKAFAFAGAEIIGADIGENKYAKIHIPDKGSLPLTNSSFEYVVSFQVLEHVPVPYDYLTEAYRLLKPGGKLFLTTHGVWPYHPTPGDYHRWTREGLAFEMERAGFDVQFTSHLLNDYSAAVQSFVMSGDYRGTWKKMRGLVHLVTHVIILLLERCERHDPQTPAVICILGVRR